MEKEQQQQQSEYGNNLAAIQRHLDRLDERLERMDEKLDGRTRDLATKQDVEGLRKDMVTQNYLESRLNVFSVQIARLQQDRTDDKKDVDEQFTAMTNMQASRSERLWMRLGPVLAAIALLITLIEFLAHVHFTP